MKEMRENRQGQSLAEVLIAAAVTAILLIAAISLISPVLRNNRQVGVLRITGAMNREVLDKTRSLAQADWHAIANLSTSSAYRYSLTTSTSPFSIINGDEEIVIGSSTYTRYFYIDEVLRDPSTGEITTSTLVGVPDPSTRQITIVVVPPQGNSSTIEQIVTRSQSSVSIQSDWSGGGGLSGAVSGTTNQFASSSNVSVSDAPGSLILNNL